MIFQDFDLRTKRWLLLFLLCLLFWWLLSASGTCSAASAPRTYIITEEELVTLENNLARLSAINNQLQLESKKQSTQAKELQEQVRLLQNQLAVLRQESERQQELLTKANKSLAEFATEAKRTRLKIKAQRNFWECLAVAAVVGLIVK